MEAGQMTMVADDRRALMARQRITLPHFIAALLLVLLSLLGMMLWPAWSERERLRRRAIVDALTGEARL
jgi:hypothetical protein